MKTSEIILTDVKALNPKTTIMEIKKLFKKTTFTHLPIIEANKIIGLISETDVFTLENDNDEIISYSYLFDFFYTDEKTTCLNLLKLFAFNETNLIPVVNADNHYVGYFDLNDIIHLFYNTPFLNENGAIIVVEKNIIDYSFSEITQIVETNNGKILGLFVSNLTSDKAEITIKLSVSEINDIINTFRRYNYKILSDHTEDFYLEDLKERSDYLRKYLNI